MGTGGYGALSDRSRVRVLTQQRWVANGGYGAKCQAPGVIQLPAAKTHSDELAVGRPGFGALQLVQMRPLVCVPEGAIAARRRNLLWRF